MRVNQYYENLIKNVIELSKSSTWELAVQEWEIVDCKIDEGCSESCVCGKENLKYLFTIRNVENDNVLYPIGSTCINKFERDDLDYEISVYKDMFKLMHAVENKEYIELTSKYFSKKLLCYLYDNNAFKPNKYNDFDGENDCDFLLDMFKKRNKDRISDSCKRKIKAIILNSIIPFVKSRVKLKSRMDGQVCPRCGGTLVVRTAKTGINVGQKFLGCTNYPDCKFTKNVL